MKKQLFIISDRPQWVGNGRSSRTVSLSPVDGSSENKDRRNRFYEQFGLQFNYSDPDLRGGVSQPMPASDLQPVDALKDYVQILTVSDFIGARLRETERLQRTTATQLLGINQLQSVVDEARKKPLRWAARQLCARFSVWIFPIVLFLGAGYAIYSSLAGP
jgi:hypothetical protein